MVKTFASRPIIFLAETVFVYFREEEIKTLVLTLRNHFPGAELVFNGWRLFELWLANRHLSNPAFAGLMRWDLWSSKKITRWGEDIELLGEWSFFDQPEPRMNAFRWMAPLFRLFKPMRIFHFRLGESPRQVRPGAA